MATFSVFRDEHAALGVKRAGTGKLIVAER
jgi:hypothetical protein